jgi:hypothetical protein
MLTFHSDVSCFCLNKYWYGSHVDQVYSAVAPRAGRRGHASMLTSLSQKRSRQQPLRFSSELERRSAPFFKLLRRCRDACDDFLTWCSEIHSGGPPSWNQARFSYRAGCIDSTSQSSDCDTPWCARTSTTIMEKAVASFSTLLATASSDRVTCSRTSLSQNHPL